MVLNSSSFDSSALARDTDPAARKVLRTSTMVMATNSNFFISFLREQVEIDDLWVLTP
jgi:hypothetical protein